ncbi:ECF RNA polymerase sigma factor SigK [Nocardia neocaledoniensis NBRC 108232]|uniref:RNA polymerase sigma-70 factor (ECF subfamily) n=1 Tax=Nocardia neocaledoniensis TaxID=236511 RepID=A0A317N857_9NOCA|nr:ECF RNA polymerase sigma factor SigK [Nocardia neocaledoniensis]PWV71083.1 RNA polymerase sigma-70 factor (ECF subfamily) [Nocardia neocaledoniensis]GEM35042.1 ECF RNA polymerase sigma factor SigK [Nocardia neocaledoniensis NBRC 108232]
MTNGQRAVPIRLRSVSDPAPACPAVAKPDHAVQARLITLLDEVAAGDRRAFAEFYRATSPRVFGLALRVVRNHGAAEDIAQEVFLQVWSLAGEYDASKASPIGWLMMLTHRRAVDRVRAEQSATNRDLVFGHAHLGRDHDIVAEEVGQRLDEQSVLDCLDTMTELQRQAVALAYYSGRTYAEVSETLAVPLPTVKSRIRDGLKRLENCLTGGAAR